MFCLTFVVLAQIHQIPDSSEVTDTEESLLLVLFVSADGKNEVIFFDIAE